MPQPRQVSPIADIPYSKSTQGASKSKHSAGKRRLDQTHQARSAKRAKRDSLFEQKMYSFSSNKANGSTVVDLTRSPPASPAKAQRRLSGAVRPSLVGQPSGTKKLVVKNFRTRPKTSLEEYANNVWHRLDAALNIIFKQGAEPFSLEELYRGVENVCRQGGAPGLSVKLKAKCKDHVQTVIRGSLVEQNAQVNAVSTVRLITKEWATWQRQMTTVRSIFYYMDRSYLLHSSSQLSIEELRDELFRSYVFQDSTLSPVTLRGICDLVSHDRRDSGGEFDENLLKGAVNMLHDLKVYTRIFEPRLLADSQIYIRQWADIRTQERTLAQYVSGVQALIASEEARCRKFGLEDGTRRAIVTQIELLAIEAQDEVLTEQDSVIDLMKKNEVGSLGGLFKLLQRKHLGEKLRPAFEAYIEAQGTNIVTDEARENDMVIRLLLFKQKVYNILEQAFLRNSTLSYGLKQAFDLFMNKRTTSNMTWGTDNNKPGEMIAKYLDAILREGVKAIPTAVLADDGGPGSTHDEEDDGSDVEEDAQITKQLDQVLELFRYVHGKAVFEEFYKKALAKRLLMQRSASADAEKSMLTRLREECGANFTSKLEQMFKDMDTAREENLSYKQLLEDRHQKQPVDLNANVLSMAAWPTYPDVAVEVPPEIQSAQASFASHYKTKHTGRTLHWKHSLAHCQLKARFPKGDKELVVSAYQAIVLLCFNDLPTALPDGTHPQLSYSEIQARTRLPDDELKRTLQSLACARHQPLRKYPKGRDVDVTDSFTVNLNFTHEKMRVKINQIQLKETKEENKATHERVAADRQYETQAAIVRIMKAEKKIRHAQLMAKVVEATRTRGVLEFADIKKQIDKLIDKDYMDRDENEDGVYNYVA